MIGYSSNGRNGFYIARCLGYMFTHHWMMWLYFYTQGWPQDSLRFIHTWQDFSAMNPSPRITLSIIYYHRTTSHLQNFFALFIYLYFNICCRCMWIIVVEARMSSRSPIIVVVVFIDRVSAVWTLMNNHSMLHNLRVHPSIDRQNCFIPYFMSVCVCARASDRLLSLIS